MTTIKTLEALITLLNKSTANPLTPYSGGTPNIGNYHLYQAYGGVGLCRMHEHGSVDTIFTITTKHELEVQIHALMRGLEIAGHTK